MYVAADMQLGGIAVASGSVGSIVTDATMNGHTSALAEVRTAEAIARPDSSSDSASRPLNIVVAPDLGIAVICAGKSAARLREKINRNAQQSSTRVSPVPCMFHWLRVLQLQKFCR